MPDQAIPPLPELERKGTAVLPTPELFVWVETVLELGVSPAEIAAMIGVSERTFYRKFRTPKKPTILDEDNVHDLGELVEVLAGIGISSDEISKAIGYSRTRTQAEFGKRIKGATERVTGNVIRAMYRRTLLENSIGQRAGEFWLRVHAGWETPVDMLVKMKLGRRSPFMEEFPGEGSEPVADEVRALPMGEARDLIRATMKGLDREGRDAMRKVIAQLENGGAVEAEIVEGSGSGDSGVGGV